MIKNRNTTIGLIIASVIAETLILIIKGSQLNVAEIAGGTVGFILIPYLLTILIRWICKVTSIDFTESSFFKTFLTIWIILILLNIVSSNQSLGQSKVNIDSDQSFYTYSPKGCLFEIQFKEKPKINEISTTNGNARLKAEVAELVMVDDRGYVKSELIILGRDTIKYFNRGKLSNILEEYSVSNGFAHPQFKNTENELGKQVELRGYKTLKDEKLNERRMIMTAHLYFKANNLLILYGASEAKDYPTPGITKFLNSIKLKDEVSL